MAEYGFDTLEAAEALAAAGMAEAHAKAIAVTMRKAVTQGVATSSDVRRVEDRMATKADLTNFEVRVDTRLVRLETRLVLTVFGAAGLLFAALKLFPAGAP